MCQKIKFSFIKICRSLINLSLINPREARASDHFRFANWSTLRKDSARHNVILGAVTGADNSRRANQVEASTSPGRSLTVLTTVRARVAECAARPLNRDRLRKPVAGASPAFGTEVISRRRSRAVADTHVGRSRTMRERRKDDTDERLSDRSSL